jgi:predicted double-glycine peptidase
VARLPVISAWLAVGVTVFAAIGAEPSTKFHVFDDDAIRIFLPPVTQVDDYSCGVACLYSIFEYYGIDRYEYAALEKKLGATEQDGTDFKRIVSVARQEGLVSRAQEEMDLDDLIALIKENKPVIVSMQAYETNAKKILEIYYDGNVNGHFVVAIGYDNDNLYFMDPSLPRRRAFLPKAEFVKRWHDDEGTKGHPNIIRHLGLVIYHDPADLHRAKVIE